MREILFKAKRIDNGEWVEGDLVRSYLKIGNACITDFAKGIVCGVDEETICQYTGLTDKNGTKIWENDVVKGRHWAEPENIHRFRVDWSEKSGVIVFKDSLTIDAELSIHDFCDFGEVEVIGNIFDNPVLVRRCVICGKLL